MKLADFLADPDRPRTAEEMLSIIYLSPNGQFRFCPGPGAGDRDLPALHKAMNRRWIEPHMNGHGTPNPAKDAWIYRVTYKGITKAQALGLRREAENA